MQIPMDSELPLGLGMALARNPAAMAAFTAMSPQERRAVIEGTHRVRSAAARPLCSISLQSGRKPTLLCTSAAANAATR